MVNLQTWVYGKKGVGMSTLLDLAMLALVLAVSAYLIIGQFNEGDEQLQCVTGKCVLNNPSCIPEQAKTVGENCGEEDQGVCIQSFDKIPATSNGGDQCRIRESGSDSGGEEEEPPREEVGNEEGSQSDSSEYPKAGDVFIEVREGQNSQKQPSISFPQEQSELKLFIWTRPRDSSHTVSNVNCEVALLDSSNNYIEGSVKQGSCGYEKEYREEDVSDESIVDYTLDRSTVESESLLQIIAYNRTGGQIASIQLDISK
jgi:hypothetical protein